MNKNVAVIILAAGKSTRMKSDIPKVLHPICSRPMLEYVLDLVRSLRADKTVLVLGHKHELVKKLLKPDVKIAIQRKLLGTADAVKEALRQLKSFKGVVLVLYADNPLLKKETITKLLNYHKENNPAATLLTAQLKNPKGYGRILRDKYSSICGIAEEKDADDFQKGIKEINTGIICFNKTKLEGALRYIRPNNRKKEYYLTDVVGLFSKRGDLVDAVKITDINEALGINSRKELAEANKIMQRRIHEQFMKDGISIVDPNTTFISYGTKIGEDSTIYPFTVIERNVRIGKRCSVGPFAHLRGSVQLDNDVSVGNFGEIVRSRISSKTKAKHFCYIGDTRIGKQVNIGAGTVTANYSHGKKNLTVIGDGAFIGSDTILVAPVKVGKKAITGAGSVVVKRKNIPAGKTAVGVPARILKDKR
ncbi:MAG: NTP transferase domain-containing protein [Candidatus Omnitrophica bacterium]|nr:NTP transferase domain-containing protein [Candidatus Omnitrophota bacterium]